MTYLVYGCGLSGTWPNLSDEIPNASERVRVIERPAASATPTSENYPVLSTENAATRLNEINEDIENAERAYSATLNNFTTASSDEPATLNRLWFEAQLSLTRYSQTVSMLDDIIFNESLKDSALSVDAQQIKNKYTANVVNERRKLEQIKPKAVMN